MAIDGIGGVGAINVSTQTRTPKQQTSEIQIADFGGANAQVQAEGLKPVEKKSDSNNQNEDPNRDRASVQTEGELSKEKVQSAVEDLNKQLKQKANPLHGTQLSFKYHDDTNRISITVTNSDTDEVIREIPPEKALDMLAKAWEMAGLLIDEKR